MRSFLSVCCLAISAILLSACNQASDNKGSLSLQPAGQAWGALYQQRASEYKALAFQAYNIAQLRLDQQLKLKSKRPLAIITDIDETVLDNSPYFVALAKQGEVYSDSSWVKWTAQVKCDTVPGAARFLKYAANKGVAVFYITNRFEQERLSTLKNLNKWGLPQAESSHLFLMNTDDSKDQRRLQVEKTYDVALLLGDSLGDFDKFFDHLTDDERTAHTQQSADLFGSRFIVLPNAMYGSWEDVLYKGKDAKSIRQKNQILANDLK
jgi:5'-nucleotidase (lipoprotein e(P4) family)